MCILVRSSYIFREIILGEQIPKLFSPEFVFSFCVVLIMLLNVFKSIDLLLWQEKQLLFLTGVQLLYNVVSFCCTAK